MIQTVVMVAGDLRLNAWIDGLRMGLGTLDQLASSDASKVGPCSSLKPYRDVTNLQVTSQYMISLERKGESLRSSKVFDKAVSNFSLN